MSKDSPPPLSRREIDGAFSEVLRVPRPSVAYLLGLCIVAFLMVLLPICYFCLVGIATYGVYYHATVNARVFEHSRGRAAALLYIGPLIAGLVLVFFMIAPLFRRNPRSTRSLQISDENEPAFCEYVTRVCNTVGAPVPRRIRVNGEINASPRPMT